MQFYDPENQTNCNFHYSIPGPQDPVLTIRLVMHVIQRETPENKLNFDETDPDHVAYLIQSFDKLNLIYELNDVKMCDGMSQGYQNVRDSRVRFQLDGIQYHRDDEHYTQTGEGKLLQYGYCPERVINVFFIERHDAVKHSGKVIGSNHFEMVGFYNSYLEIGNQSDFMASVMAHELGHIFGLGHSWNQVNVFSDICQSDSEWCSDPAVCPNNVMGNPPRKYFSPQQLGYIYHTLQSNTGKTRYINSDYDVNASIYITEPTIWDKPMVVLGDIHVATGAELIVQCKVIMKPAGRIVVYRGARLIIDGLQSNVIFSNGNVLPPKGGLITVENSTVTSDCEDGEGYPFWKGIEVWGNTNKQVGADILDPANPLASDDPGILILKNGGAIWRAETGVYGQARQEDINWPNQWDYFGGIIHVDLGVFQNCGTAISYLSRKPIAVPSRLNSCYINVQPSAPASAFGKAKGLCVTRVNGLEIDNQSVFHRLNEGIVLHDAHAEVRRSSFQNVRYGIYKNGLMTSLQGETYIGGGSDLGNVFQNCYLPIYGQNVGKITVSYNTYVACTHGAVLDGPSIFNISFNTIINNSSSSSTFGGFAALNTGGAGANSLLLCNDFVNTGSADPIWFGLYLGGDNASTVFAGNTFSSRFDTYVTDYGVPGYLPDQKLDLQPNFNRFTSVAESYHLADIFTHSPNFGHSLSFKYFPPVDNCDSEYMSSRPKEGLCFDPHVTPYFFHNDDELVGFDIPICADFEPTYPTRIQLGDCGSHIACIDSLNYRLAMIDSKLADRDSPVLYGAIHSIPGALTTLTMLTDATPFLSDSMLITLATSAVDSSFRVGIMMDHVPLSPRVLLALKDLEWDSVTVRLLDSLSGFFSTNSRLMLLKERYELQSLKYGWLRQELDSLLVTGDSLMAWQLLVSDTARITQEWQLALRLYTDDLAGGSQMLASWPDAHPYDVAFKDIQQIHLALLEEGHAWVPANVDSVRLQQLAQHPSPYSGMAQALLYRLYDLVQDPVLTIVVDTASLRQAYSYRDQIVPSHIQSRLSVFPNPAFGEFRFHLEGALPLEAVDLYLYNMQGKLCFQDRRSVLHQVVNLEGLPNGMYFLRVVSEDGANHVVKVALW
jgi:hypothetical protein